MKALIVYESMYGNTHVIAERIAGGLGAAFDTDVVPVAQATPERVATADLLVVGGPTHVHGMSTARTRAAAATAAAAPGATIVCEADATDRGLRDWFDELPPGGGRRAVAFDTRMKGPKSLTGRAVEGHHPSAAPARLRGHRRATELHRQQGQPAVGGRRAGRNRLGTAARRPRPVGGSRASTRRRSMTGVVVAAPGHRCVDDLERLRVRARRFLRAHAIAGDTSADDDPRGDRALDRALGFQRALHAAGLAGLSVSPAVGGHGLPAAATRRRGGRRPAASR